MLPPEKQKGAGGMLCPRSDSCILPRPFGDLEAWWLRGLETWRQGGMEAWMDQWVDERMRLVGWRQDRMDGWMD